MTDDRRNDGIPNMLSSVRSVWAAHQFGYVWSSNLHEDVGQVRAIVAGDKNLPQKYCCVKCNNFIKLTVIGSSATHREGIVAFPLQQWLGESETMLRCKYSPYIVLVNDPQDEVGPSISSSVVLCSFVLLVYIVVLVLVVCLCPSSVHVVATFSGTVLFPLLYSVLPFFAKYIDFFRYLVLLFQVIVSNTSIVLLINVVPLFSSVPKLHFQISMLL